MPSDPRDDADQILDVREIEGEPFETIMAELGDLSGDESLLLINSFEPEPLYAVLADRGFEFETAQPTADEWHVTVSVS